MIYYGVFSKGYSEIGVTVAYFRAVMRLRL